MTEKNKPLASPAFAPAVKTLPVAVRQANQESSYGSDVMWYAQNESLFANTAQWVLRQADRHGDDLFTPPEDFYSKWLPENGVSPRFFSEFEDIRTWSELYSTIKNVKESEKFSEISSKYGVIGNIGMISADPTMLVGFGLTTKGFSLAKNSTMLYRNFMTRNATRGALGAAEFSLWEKGEDVTRAGYEANYGASTALGSFIFGVGGAGYDVVTGRAVRQTLNKNNLDEIKLANSQKEVETKIAASAEADANAATLSSQKVTNGDLSAHIEFKMAKNETKWTDINNREAKIDESISNDKVALEATEEFINETPDSSEILNKINNLDKTNKTIIEETEKLNTKIPAASVKRVSNNLKGKKINDEDLDFVSEELAKLEIKNASDDLASQADTKLKEINTSKSTTYKKELDDVSLQEEAIKKLEKNKGKINKTEYKDTLTALAKKQFNENDFKKLVNDDVTNDIKILNDEILTLESKTLKSKPAIKANNDKIGRLKSNLKKLESELSKGATKKRNSAIKKTYSERLSQNIDIKEVNSIVLKRKADEILKLKSKAKSSGDDIDALFLKSKAFKSLDKEHKALIKKLTKNKALEGNAGLIKKAKAQKIQKLSGKKTPDEILDKLALRKIKKDRAAKLQKLEANSAKLQKEISANKFLDSAFKQRTALKASILKGQKSKAKLIPEKRKITISQSINRKAIQELNDKNPNALFDTLKAKNNLIKTYIDNLAELNRNTPKDVIESGTAGEISPEFFEPEFMKRFTDEEYMELNKDIPDWINVENTNIPEGSIPRYGSDEYLELLGLSKKDFDEIDLESAERIGHSIVSGKGSSIPNATKRLKDSGAKKDDPTIDNVDEELQAEIDKENGFTKASQKLVEESIKPSSIYGYFPWLRDWAEKIASDDNKILAGLGMSILEPISVVAKGKGQKSLEMIKQRLDRQYKDKFSSIVNGGIRQYRIDGGKDFFGWALGQANRRKMMEDVSDYIRDTDEVGRQARYESQGAYGKMVASIGEKGVDLNIDLVNKGIKSGHEYFMGMKPSRTHLPRNYDAVSFNNTYNQYGEGPMTGLFKTAIASAQKIGGPDGMSVEYLEQLSQSMVQIIQKESTGMSDVHSFLNGQTTLQDALYVIRDQVELSSGIKMTKEQIDDIINWNKKRLKKNKQGTKQRMVLDENVEYTLKSDRPDVPDKTIRFADLLIKDFEAMFDYNVRASTGRTVLGNNGVVSERYFANALKEAMELEDRTKFTSKVMSDTRNKQIEDMMKMMENTMYGRPIKNSDFSNDTSRKIVRILKNYAVAVYLGKAFISYMAEYGKTIALSPKAAMIQLTEIVPNMFDGVIHGFKTLDNLGNEVARNRQVREVNAMFGEQITINEMPMMSNRVSPDQIGAGNFESSGNVFTDMLDKADYPVRALARAATTINSVVEGGLRVVTHKAATQNFIDIASGAKGLDGYTGINRGMFDQLGLTEEAGKRLFKDVKKYITTKDGLIFKNKYESVDYLRWADENPASYADFEYAITSIVDGVILRPSNSRTFPWMSNAFLDLLSLFRTFSLQAINQDLIRPGVQRNKLFAANTIGMLTMGSFVYTAQTYVNAASKPADEREAYLKKRLTATNMAAGAYSRMSWAGTTLPVVDNLAQHAFGLDPIFGPDVRATGLSTGFIEGNPAIQSAKGFAQAAKSGLLLLSHGETPTQQEIRTMEMALPLQNVPGIRNVLDQVRFKAPKSRPKDED